ncbi:MAG: hypothetical protein IPK66_02770 [Rhodospirillales bacterium]|nr:hypothetical protein [Rhodospirillales bacterium]
MGGMLPTAAMSVMQMGLESAQQGAASAQAQAEADAQVQQIRQTQQIDSQQRRDQLRRALATQRARFGAQGITGGASSQAVLSGIEADAAQEEADSQALSNLRIGKIQQDADWQRRRNLLDASSPTYRSAFSLVQRGLRSVPLLDSRE